MTDRILAIEDEPAIRDMVRFALQRHGFEVHTAESVEEARSLMKDTVVDLALVDWMLPGASGLEFVRSLRRDDRFKNLPIVMLTARTEEVDVTAGLDAGADDYVTKPFSPRELHSRIKALLRRSQNFATDEGITRGPLTLDTSAHRVTAQRTDGQSTGDQTEITLGHTEFKLLAFLMKNPDRVFTRSQLLDNVWGPGTFIEDRTVDVHILRLRKSLKPFGADTLIDTIRGAGYRLLDPPSDS